MADNPEEDDQRTEIVDLVLCGDWQEVEPPSDRQRNNSASEEPPPTFKLQVVSPASGHLSVEESLESEMEEYRKAHVQKVDRGVQTPPMYAAETEYWPPADSTRSKSRMRSQILAGTESSGAEGAENIPPPAKRTRALERGHGPSPKISRMRRDESPRSRYLKANKESKKTSTRYVVVIGDDSNEENPGGSATYGAPSSPRNGSLHLCRIHFRNCFNFAMLEMTSAYSYVLNRICEDVQQEMAGKAKEDEFEWTVNAEVLFFYALIGHKPVGVNRHFMMLLIHNKFSNFINREISSKVLWDRLDTMYDMTALHESEIIPFPNDEVDFELPEDCHDLLQSKFGVTLERPNSENNDVDKNSASTSKSSKKPAPKIKQSSTPTSTSKSNFATPVLSKPSKSQSSVKSETKSSDATPKAKLELGSSSKAGKIKRSSSPFSNKTVKSESLSVTKEDSPDISTNKKNSKLERGSSPAVLKKPVKVESATTNNASKKPAKSESNSNGSKQIKSETPDSSAKKIKSEKDLPAKKGKTTSSSTEVSTKKPKADVNSVKKKNEHESSSKKSGNESSSVKQTKAEVKSSSHSSKGQETGTPPPSGSRKSSPVVKVKGNESSKKLKRPKLEENSKKLTPASKRRRQ